MAALEISRVAEVMVTLGEGARGRRGSGYRVADSLVLTAAHVLVGATNIRVRFEADHPGEWSAAVTDVLSLATIDVALLTIRQPEPVKIARASFGRIGERDAAIECSAVGFPLWKLRDDSSGQYRDSAHIVGRAAILANRREGTLEIAVAPPERDPDPSVSPWEGMSGAAVFCGAKISASI